MPKSIGLTINNSKKSAVKSGTWKDPGAKFYDTLMWAYDNRWVADGRNTLPEEKESKNWHYWQDFLKEAYLKAPVSKITNKGPYGMTPFARSGCKYPHHAIRNGNLVVSVPGLKAAYTRVCQMHELKGDIKEHLERHIKELGIQASFHDGMLSWNEAHEVKIEENFNSIYDYIQENTGIDLHDNYMTEASHGKLKYDFRFGWDYNTGHQVKIVYSLDNIEVTGVGDFYWKYNKDNKNPDGSLKMDEGQYKDWVSKNITRKGNNDHQSKGQKVLSIIDLVTNKKLKSVKLMSPISLDGTEYRFTHYTAIPNEILDEARRLATNNHGISMIKTGEVDNNPSFKSTSWFTNVIDKTTGENLRFNKLAKAEFIKLGRGIKPDDIQAKNFEIKSDPNIRPLLFKNPSKKEALTELYCIEKNAIYWIDIFKYAINNNRYPKGWDYNSTKQLLDQYMNKLKYIKHDISLINAGKYNLSMMQKYKNERMIESAEEEREKYLENNKHVDYIPPSNGIPYYAIPFPEDVEVLESVETYIMEEAINDILDQGGVTPQEVFEWIRSNISYDKASPSEWKLKSPQETYDLKKGNCHDQSLLAFTLFKSMGYKRGQIFFIEYKEGETVGGNTHTFTWYIEDDKYYWFETAWENKAGIHGPYDSIAELKEDVRKEWNNDNDINSRSYSGVYWDGIEFSETSKYKVGMGLGDYVDSWVFVEDIKEAMDWIDAFVHNETFRENVDNDFYYRISYDGIGIYEALKRSIPLDTWKSYLKSDNFTRLPNPGNYPSGYRSYFTKDGYEMYQKHIYPILIKHLDKNKIKVQTFNNIENIVYRDKYQVITNNSNFDNISIMQNLPDKLYFASSVKMDKLTGRVFLTPHIGIASLFIVNLKPVMRDYFAKYADHELTKFNYNSGYEEWNWDNDKLQKPLDMIHINHNVPEYTQVETGSSSGFIHVVDISSVKDQLKTFVTNNPDREVIYEGNETLPIIEVIPHTVNWEINYNESNTIEHGKGFVESCNILDEKVDNESLEEDNSRESSTTFTEDAADLAEKNNDDVPPSISDDADKEENDVKPEENSEDPEEKKKDDELAEEEESIEDETPEEEDKEKKEEPKKEEKPLSRPKQTDAAEKDKNGVRRKKLYIAFIEWCKEYNNKNTFGSIFDKDAFNVSYPFVPHEMRYFYRLANPMLCVLSGNLTFFQVAELKKLNSKNSKFPELLIFAATENDLRVFSNTDKKVYFGIEENGEIKLTKVLSDTFDTYIQTMIGKGDILNGPIEDKSEKSES